MWCRWVYDNLKRLSIFKHRRHLISWVLLKCRRSSPTPWRTTKACNVLIYYFVDLCFYFLLVYVRESIGFCIDRCIGCRRNRMFGVIRECEWIAFYVENTREFVIYFSNSSHSPLFKWSRLMSWLILSVECGLLLNVFTELT